MQDTPFEVPRLGPLARHAVPHLVEAVLAPLAIFYATMWVVGIWGALAAGLLWSYTAIAVRLATRRRVPGILLLGAAGLTARTIIAAATGSVFVYFLQPTLGTVAMATAFLLSACFRRPLAHRLAADFCPLPPWFTDHPHVLAFFRRLSLLWGLVYLTNAGMTMWLLISQSVGTFLLLKTVLSWALTGSAILASTLWFKRCMRRNGLPVVWPHRRGASTVAA